MRKHAALRFLLLFGAASCGGEYEARARQDPARIDLSVTDTVAGVDRSIAPGLRLEIRRDGSAGSTSGWDVAVRATADTTGENLLYHSREWHGPYPTQVYAWSEAANYFGQGARELAVRGHPWLVTIRCDGCTTAGAGETAHFTGGELTVEWRRTSTR